MLRITLTLLIALSLLSLSSRSETPQFQTTAATEAVSEYLRTVETARRECMKQLEAAEKDALQSGDREESVRIQSARAAIDGHRAADVFDPFASLEQQIEGTKWANADNARLWSAFDEDHKLRNTKGEAGRWAVVSENTVASTTGVKYVYLWVFGEDGRGCTLQRFNHDTNHSRSYVKQ